MGAPRPTLKARDVLAITVGIVVGAGIFRTPALVAGNAGSGETMLLVWMAGGMLSIIGALCYAELASTYPSIGGDYHFLNRAYGSSVGFLYAWARLAVIQTGSIALLAYVFGDYLAAILPVGPHSPAIYAAAAVILIGAINWLGVSQSVQAQRWLTVVEVSGLMLVIIAGLLLAPAAHPLPPARSEGAIGLMMVFVLLTYGGWSETVYVSAEIEGAPRRLRWIMVSGLALVTLLYVLANVAFLRVLGLTGMASSDAVAAEVMRRAIGISGAVVISLLVAIAALSSANATLITGARTTCALGRTVPALRWLGLWDTNRNTPANAVIVQSIVAMVLVDRGRILSRRVPACRRIYRPRLLAVHAADRTLPVHSSRSGSRRRSSGAGAIVSATASDFLCDERVSALFQPRLHGRRSDRRGCCAWRRHVASIVFSPPAGEGHGSVTRKGKPLRLERKSLSLAGKSAFFRKP